MISSYCSKNQWSLWGITFPDQCPEAAHLRRDTVEWEVIPQRSFCSIRVIHHMRRYAKFHGCACPLVVSWPSETRSTGIAGASKVSPCLLNFLHHGFAVRSPPCEDNYVQIVNHTENKGELHTMTRIVRPISRRRTVGEQIHIGRLPAAVDFRETN